MKKLSPKKNNESLSSSQSLSQLNKRMRKQTNDAPSLSELHHSRSAYLFSCRHNGLIAFKSMDSSYAGLSSMYTDIAQQAHNQQKQAKNKFGCSSFSQGPRFASHTQDNSPGPVYNIRDHVQPSGKAWSFRGGVQGRTSFIPITSTDASVGPTSYMSAEAKEALQPTIPSIHWSASRSKRWAKTTSTTPGPKYSPTKIQPGYASAVNFGPKQQVILPSASPPKKDKKSSSSSSSPGRKHSPSKSPSKNEQHAQLIEEETIRLEKELRRTVREIKKEKEALNFKPSSQWAGRLPPRVSLPQKLNSRIPNLETPGAKYDVGHKDWTDSYPRNNPFVPKFWR